jgi:CHAT domain-containing protein
LSACEAAVDSPKAELGFAGLARSSGVNSVVATLWRVADASTPILMDEFYKQLRDGKLKSEALQQAQVLLINGKKEFSHPFFWASFTLIGNP